MTDGDLVHGGVCPICGEEFTDGMAAMAERQGESIEGVRVCVIEAPEPPDGKGDMLVHLPDDVSAQEVRQ